MYFCFMLFHLGSDQKVKGLAAPSNLSMNQTLEGHSGKFWLLGHYILLIFFVLMIEVLHGSVHLRSFEAKIPNPANEHGSQNGEFYFRTVFHFRTNHEAAGSWTGSRRVQACPTKLVPSREPLLS